MRKKIKVVADHKYGSAGMLPGLPLTETWDCNVLISLLWIGIVTAPPRYRGFDLSTCWAWLRYASALSHPHPGLRLGYGWSETDTHQMTVMSDDFGMGFSCHYLAEQHGLEAFANTNAVLDDLVGVTSLRPSKRGPAKSPDFIAVDAQGRLHILECKGTQSSVAYLRKSMAAGVEQKNNFTNGTPFASTMVGGIFVPQFDSDESAVLIYIDPEPNERLQQLSKLPRDVIVNRIYRFAFAKELMAAGLWSTANHIAAPAGVDGRYAPEPIETELAFAGFSRAGDQWRRSTNHRYLQRRSDLSPQRVTDASQQTTLLIEVAGDVVSFSREVLGLDAIGKHGQAQELIAQRISERRRPRDVSSFTDVNLLQTESRYKVPSAWQEEEIDEQSAVLMGPSGVRFTLRLGSVS